MGLELTKELVNEQISAENKKQSEKAMGEQ